MNIYQRAILQRDEKERWIKDKQHENQDRQMQTIFNELKQWEVFSIRFRTENVEDHFGEQDHLFLGLQEHSVESFRGNSDNNEVQSSL